MSDLINLNYDKLQDAKGLINNGAICYFNSLLQCLSSCTSICEISSSNQFEHYLQRDFIEFIPLMTVNLHRILSMPHGQDSPREALHMLLDKCLIMKKLFSHKYRCTIQCLNCNEECSSKEDVNFTIEMFNPTGNFIRDILIQKTQLDDYMCDKCKTKSTVERIYTLRMLPEILIITFNIYFTRTAIDFPITMNVTKKLKYTLVGQIIHYGSLHGGHYVAVVLKKNGIFLISDTSVQPYAFKPDPNTYMLIYHKVE